MQLPSSLLENAVAQFAKLPGIGKKTALRLVLHLLKQEVNDVQHFGETIAKMRRDIKFCHRCHNISDGDICSICSNSMRNQQLICVVENIRDVIAIESTQQFNGSYHVLGGIISPLDGIGPDQLSIESLVSKNRKRENRRTGFCTKSRIFRGILLYIISRKNWPISPCRITTIARGIAFGGELEYADEMTLARSIANRLPIQQYVK